MSRDVVLQHPVTFSTGDSVQRIDAAYDLGTARTMILQARRLGSAGTGTVSIEHAPVLDEAAFEPVGSTWSIGGLDKQAIVYTGLSRFVRWRAASVTGSPVIQLVGLARDDRPSAGIPIRLQELVALNSAAPSQSVALAVDVSRFRTVTAQVRVAVAGAVGATLTIQHAPELDESAFESASTLASPSGDFSLSGVGVQVKRFSNLMRWIRWIAVHPGGTDPVFQVDLLARGA